MAAVGSAAPAPVVIGDASDAWTRLMKSPSEVLRRGSWKKAEIRRVRGARGWVVIKDARDAPAPIRRLVSWLFAREADIYDRLADMPEVPRLVGARCRILATEHVSGRRISAFMHGKGRGLGLGSRLQATIGEMHRRGVYHGDLHYRHNILVTDDGDIRIIDFASAVDVRRAGWVGRLIRPVLALSDRYALVKWKGSVEPESMTRGERRLLAVLDMIRLKSRHRRR